MDSEKENLRFYSFNIACRQYRSSDQICLELRVWMSSFLNIRSSRTEVSCEKGALKIFAKFVEKYLWMQSLI